MSEFEYGYYLLNDYRHFPIREYFLGTGGRDGAERQMYWSYSIRNEKAEQ